MRSVEAQNAYQRASNLRNHRDQEAELFTLVNIGLKNALNANPVVLAKAISDNERLWILVMDILRDPANKLPISTRTAILSIGHAARREMAAKSPDLMFLVGLNEQMAIGLAGG